MYSDQVITDQVPKTLSAEKSMASPALLRIQNEPTTSQLAAANGRRSQQHGHLSKYSRPQSPHDRLSKLHDLKMQQLHSLR